MPYRVLLATFTQTLECVLRKLRLCSTLHGFDVATNHEQNRLILIRVESLYAGAVLRATHVGETPTIPVKGGSGGMFATGPPWFPSRGSDVIHPIT